MKKKIIMLDGRQKTNNRDGYETHAFGRVLTNRKRTSSLGGEDANVTTRSFARTTLIGRRCLINPEAILLISMRRLSFLMVKRGANPVTSLYCGFTNGACGFPRVSPRAHAP